MEGYWLGVITAGWRYCSRRMAKKASTWYG